MAWSIKPYLGSEPIALISAYDEAIDWDLTEQENGISIELYIEAPWKHQDSLFVKDGVVPVKIYMRAPTPFDLRDTEQRKITMDPSSDEQRLEVSQTNEAFDLFRRCLEDLRDYYPNGTGKRLEVSKEAGPGGIQWASEATISQIPYEVICEMGRYLRMSQQVGDDLKND